MYPLTAWSTEQEKKYIYKYIKENYSQISSNYYRYTKESLMEGTVTSVISKKEILTKIKTILSDRKLENTILPDLYEIYRYY